MLAQIAQTAGASTEWLPAVVQGGFAAFTAWLLRWVMTTLTDQIGELCKRQERVEGALNTLSHTQLIQLLAHPDLDRSARALAETALKSVESSQAESRR